MTTVRHPIQIQYCRLPCSVVRTACLPNSTRCTVASVDVSVRVVPEARLGLEILLQPEDALVREHPAYLGAWVEQVAEHARAGGTRLDARRLLPFSGTVQAESALLHHALLASAIAEVVLHRIDL